MVTLSTIQDDFISNKLVTFRDSVDPSIVLYDTEFDDFDWLGFFDVN